MRLVFVSSTFKDMQFERDELNIRLAPRINDFLLKYGESVRFGDLRWGVNTSELESEESSKKVLKVCLDEIDNAKPYMIVFIGERYGWIPSGDLLNQAMLMKDIKDVPNDISVTNLEIEYGALLNPDYEGRILFYFRNPFDMSKMSEEEQRAYASESPVHKEKLEKLKEKIIKLYPQYVRYYDVQYDEEKKRLTGLDTLMETIYQDLTHIFDIDLEYYNSLPVYKRAIMNSEVYFESYYKYAYYRDNLKDNIDPDSELVEDYENGRYEDIPCLRYAVGNSGSGRKTTLACLYKLAKEENSEYVLPFVFGLDKFTNSKQALIETLISFFEEKLNHRIRKSKNILALADLIKYNDEHDKHHFQVFIMNHHKDIIIFLKELENAVEKMFHTTFYVMGDAENRDYSPYLAFGFHSDSIVLEELNDEEKVSIIKKICESKHKELSKVVIDRILEKESSGIPLYLSLVVERLLMLDNEDFKNIRDLGDGMGAINQYMLSIIDHLGNDVYSISKEIFKELGERINYDVVMRILYLASHNCNLDLNEYRDFFKKYGIPYNELDCSLLYNTIPALFLPVSIYNQIAFAYKEGLKAAKELSEQYVEKDFYQKYIDYLDDSEFSLIKKLAVYLSRNDVKHYYDSFALLLKKIGTNSEGLLSHDSYIDYMDFISDSMNFADDDFRERFVIYAVDQVLENDKDFDVVLSVLFYPDIIKLSTSEEQLKCVNTIWKVTKHLNGLYKNKKYVGSTNLNIVSGLIDSLNASIIAGEYAFDLSFEEEEEYQKEANKLSENYDGEAFLTQLNKVAICQIYYSMFFKRAMLSNAVSNFNYKDEYKKRQNYYMNYVMSSFDNKTLINAVLKDDFDAWKNKGLINSLTGFFYYVFIAKHTENEDSYIQKLNYYLKVAELILQNDFFDLNRSPLYETYFIPPLFQSFAKLLNEDYVDETTNYNLSDWLVIRGRELCACNVNSSSYINVYAKILDERDEGLIPDQDFFFLYPMLYKLIQKKYDNELWMMAMNLITRCTTLYDFELNEEFIFLSALRFNVENELEPILLQLATFLEARERNRIEDDLINDLYKYLFNDYELENDEQYHQYLEKYVEFIPNDAE